jgi:phosphatidylserine/phosphatidylglycerophosphate/cardiolipin synthase-like enzyme
LENSLERLLIVSPWIRAGVVDKNFLRRLRGALDRGVEVSIGYGSGNDSGALERDNYAEQALVQLAGERPNLRVVKLGDTHAKVLVVDRRYVVVTSFNWLSFRGDPDKPFRDERGMLVTVPEEIDRLFESFEARFVAPN